MTEAILSATAGDAQAIIDITREATKPAEIEALADRDLLLITDRDGQQRLLDLDEWNRYPRWQTRAVTVWDVDSLLAYVDGHTDSDECLEVWADEEQRTVTAVFDGPSRSLAGRGVHTATLRLRTTPAWTAWTSVSGKLLAQVVFAEFVEDHLPDIVKPTGAEMLELAQTFQAKTKVEFKSHQFLDNGMRALKYEESADAKAGGRGQIDIPATFDLGLKPFLGADPYRVLARLRWRIADGHLLIGFKLDRPEEVLRAAFDDVVEKIGTVVPVRVNFGRP